MDLGKGVQEFHVQFLQLYNFQNYIEIQNCPPGDHWLHLIGNETETQRGWVSVCLRSHSQYLPDPGFKTS